MEYLFHCYIIQISLTFKLSFLQVQARSPRKLAFLRCETSSNLIGPLPWERGWDDSHLGRERQRNVQRFPTHAQSYCLAH